MLSVPLLQDIGRLERDFNQREPHLSAFSPEVGRFERLRRDAWRLLSRHPHSDVRPVLYGSLVGVKDIIHVEGFPTGAGSRLPPAVLYGPDAECTTLLKHAGALILGKTHTSEFAYSAPTRNPYRPQHTPGGSSSGSAAAVAAGLCPLAIGTQTTGSISRPAAFCGVVGFKPSYDRICRSGVIPLAPSIDHVGFFTSSVDMAVQAAGVMCANWRPAKSSARMPVLGIPDGPYLARASDEGQAHFKAVCRYLASAGYQVRSVATMPDFEAIAARHNLVLDGEAALVHNKWFGAYADLYHPETAQMMRRGLIVTPAALDQARDGRVRLRQELMPLMELHGIDLWISPSAPGPAPRGLEYTGDAVMNLPWTHSGLPTLIVPAGTNSAGLPLGLQLAGSWYADEELLAWGAELERVLREKA